MPVFIALFFSYAYPLVMGRIPGMKGSLLSFVLVLLIISPFLCAIIMKKTIPSNSANFGRTTGSTGAVGINDSDQGVDLYHYRNGYHHPSFQCRFGVRTDIIFPDHCRYLFSKWIRKRSLSMENSSSRISRVQPGHFHRKNRKQEKPPQKKS